MKVIGLLLVKDEIDILPRMLDENFKWLDGIIAIDNGSTDGTYELLKKHPLIKFVKQDFREFNERLLIEELLTSFTTSNGDWFVEIDADEIFPANSREAIEKCPFGYNVISVKFKWVINNRWYRMPQYIKHRIFQYDSEYINFNAIDKLHKGKIPILLENRIVFDSDIEVLHYQIRSYEQGIKKYQRYLQLDSELTYQKSYEHLRKLSETYLTGDYYGISFQGKIA